MLTFKGGCVCLFTIQPVTRALIPKPKKILERFVSVSPHWFLEEHYLWRPVLCFGSLTDERGKFLLLLLFLVFLMVQLFLSQSQLAPLEAPLEGALQLNATCEAFLLPKSSRHSVPGAIFNGIAEAWQYVPPSTHYRLSGGSEFLVVNCNDAAFKQAKIR